jgi:transposase
MNKTSPRYAEEFKRDAVRLVEMSGKPKTQIARELGISDSALYRWLKKYGQTAEPSANGQGGPHLKDLEAENKRLRREVEVLRQERDILKKAISICSQERG